MSSAKWSENNKRDLKTIQNNLSELLGFVSYKLCPAGLMFVTQKLSILSSGLVNNVSNPPVYDNFSFNASIGYNCYSMYNNLVNMNLDYVEPYYYAELLNISTSTSLENLIFISLNTEKSREYSTVISEFYKIQNNLIFYSLEIIIRVVYLQAVTIARQLGIELVNNSTNSLISLANVKLLIENMAFIEEIFENNMDNMFRPFLMELRKLKYNFVMLQSLLL